MDQASGGPVLDHLRRLMRGEAEPAPIVKLLGMKVTAAEPGRVTLEMEAGPHLANPMGTLHGGVFCDLADAAMGMSLASLLAAGETFTTLELKINFLKPVWRSRLRAEGALLRPGRTVSLAECRIYDDKGALVAHATSTCLTLRGDAAKGR